MGWTTSVWVVPVAPVFFIKPDSNLMSLQVAPRLASWMGAGHRDQHDLEQFLAHAERAIEPQIAELADPLALRLDVGLPSAVSLLDHRDLDNYVFPLAVRLTKHTGRHFASVWGSKRHSETSLIGVERANPRHDYGQPDRSLQVRTSASSSKTAYKQQIHDQLEGVEVLPAGPVALELSFIVGPRRSWPNLWKPTIDALGRLIGSPTSGRPWHPHDGRIVELGLHSGVDPSIGNDVVIAITATAAP